MIASSTLVFSVRTASASNELGGSIAVRLKQLKDMVRHHVAQRAGRLVELGAALDADGLGDGDLHVVDMVAVPQRLEDAVGEAQHHDVLDRLLAEEMVHPIDLVLVDDLENARVQSLAPRADRCRTASR